MDSKNYNPQRSGNTEHVHIQDEQDKSKMKKSVANEKQTSEDPQKEQPATTKNPHTEKSPEAAPASKK